MNILDLSEAKQKAIADELGIDLIEMQSALLSDLSEADIGTSTIEISENNEFRMSCDLAIFIH